MRGLGDAPKRQQCQWLLSPRPEHTLCAPPLIDSSPLHSELLLRTPKAQTRRPRPHVAQSSCRPCEPVTESEVPPLEGTPGHAVPNPQSCPQGGSKHLRPHTPKPSLRLPRATQRRQNREEASGPKAAQGLAFGGSKLTHPGSFQQPPCSFLAQANFLYLREKASF